MAKSVKGKYLNPKADLTFKLIFNEHPDLAMSLLNALLPLDADGQIVSVEYLMPEMVPDNPAKKNSIVDVRCKDQQGRQFIVEMQMHWSESFRRRVILNAAKAVVREAEKAQNYTLLQPVYSLNLVNEGLSLGDAAPDEFYHDYAIVNVEHSDRIIEGLRFVFIDLKKFKPKTIAEKKMAVLWLRFLTEIDESTQEIPADLLENAETRKALEIVEKSAYTDSQLLAYDDFWMSVVDEQVIVADAQRKGMAQGRAEGMAQGRAEGMAQGKADVARNLKNMGLCVADIAKATGLTAEEIEKL
ncbi:MAG: Rpn family recombination-promoting nuclease/putative transposase [Firmicutes bacterium]|nr:Rpn family recombination-promoting nuclease/putative transposase [Bacillota bacterium]